MGNPSKDGPWEAIFTAYGINEHDFDIAPFYLSAQEIKDATKHFPKTGQKEVRILCYQAEGKDRPRVLSDNGLFLLPVKNGHYVIVKGEGYMEVSEITSPPIEFSPAHGFELKSADVGDSEMTIVFIAFSILLVMRHRLVQAVENDLKHDEDDW